KFQYLDRLPAPKSVEAIFGTLIHSALKNLHEPDRLIPPTEEELLSFWSQNWEPGIFKDQRTEAAFFAQGVMILKNYYVKNFPGDFNVLALETPFEVPINVNDNLHLITGKIDRIDKSEDGGFEVIDYKTSKKMPAQATVETDLQLSIYHLGLTNRWPAIKEEKRPVKVSLYFLKHGEKLSSLKNNEDLEKTKEYLSGRLSLIEKAASEQKFSPKPGPLCDWCAYQKHCPLFKHKFREEKIIFNDQDLNALIAEYAALKKEIEEKTERSDELKIIFGKFMDQEGMERLFAPDGYISRATIQRFKYDPNLLKNILEPIGRWNDILKIDETRLKKIALQLPADLREKINKARQLAKEYRILSFSKTKKK
ncbi:MAG: PD-(D/E)XK nuclease family protein, partial [Candidatus Portnoybacteria bacterium]|nr:PD-(D/E)XK nuclease family protein [Candidatus Portnoybacteria bacterium]